jgi:hypothetical protein
MKDLHTIAFCLFIVLLTICFSRGKAQPQSQFLMTANFSDNMLAVPIYSFIFSQHGMEDSLVANGYTQIHIQYKTQDWIRNNYLIEDISMARLIGIHQGAVKLQRAIQIDCKKNTDESPNKLGEGFNYQKLYEEVVSLRQQLAQYRKIARDTIVLDERNKILQECAINLERELQLLQQENVTLRDDNENMRFLISIGLIGVCLLAVILIPRIWENRRAQWSRL